MAMGRAFLAKAGHLNNNNKHHNSNGGGGNYQLTNGGAQSPLMHPSANTSSSSSSKAQTENTLAEVFGTKDAGLIPNKHRAFLMDTQVKYTVVSAIVTARKGKYIEAFFSNFVISSILSFFLCGKKKYVRFIFVWRERNVKMITNFEFFFFFFFLKFQDFNV